MKYPMMSKNPNEELSYNNGVVGKRCTECIFSVAHALICRLSGLKRGEDVKLRYITVSDCHNGFTDWFSVSVGISRNGYATESSSFCVNSDTPDMRNVFEDLFGHYAETRKTFNFEAEIEGVSLNLTGIGKTFLRDFAGFLHTVEDLMDEEIINPYGDLNRFGIPKDSFQKMAEEFDKITERYC
ncbi:MAG: hypothetical protein IKE01_02395 [Clostridia bacterium]|nr:hypothetical protein [Clostridia bacterium]